MKLSVVAPRYNLRVSGVLHVGAAMLEEAQEYRDMGLSTVIWVEALPGNEQRQKRAHQFNQQLYEGVVFSDREQMTTLHVASNLVSSSALPFKRHSVIYPDIVVTNTIEVYARRPDKFFADRFPKEINTLVIDAQGADLSVIKGMGWLLDQIDQIVCEVFLTELYEGAPMKDEVVGWLAGYGFRLVEFEEVHNGEWGNGLFVRTSQNDAVKTALKVPGLITEEELQILSRLTRDVDAKVVVETGTYMGRTATLFASMGATVFTIDDFSGRWAKHGSPSGLGDVETDEKQLWGAVSALHPFAAVGRVFQIIANTHTQINDLQTTFRTVLRSRKADLVFLDGNHSYECVSQELKLAEEITVQGGMICGHDLDFVNTVGKALEEHRGKNYQVLSNKLWAYTKEKRHE